MKHNLVSKLYLITDISQTRMNNTLLKILEMERIKGRPWNKSPRRDFTSRIVSDIILLHWPLGGRVAVNEIRNAIV